MRCSLRNLVALSLICMAVKGTAVQYEIVQTTTISSGFIGINNRGDLLKRGSTPATYILQHDGIDTPIPTDTGSPYYPRGLVPYDITDSGYAYGAAGTPSVSTRRAAVWSIAGGWQVMPGFGNSEVAGIAGDGRFLVRYGDTVSSLNDASWWLPGSDPVSLPISNPGRASGCDLAGNMLFNYTASQIISPTLVRHTLTFNGANASSSFITPGGIACGTSTSTGSLIFWNTSGQIIESSFSPGAIMSRCNESRIGVGWIPTPNRALYYSSATGALQLDSLLTSQFSSWTLTKSLDINDSGQILAVGRAPGSTVDSWCLLNPVPEPSTWLAMGLGTCCLLRRRRRQTS